ncbi:hypothetical protein [Planomonospora sp. ID82291]|uniref:hypothetical protein n=1 Tax=Planomonospora sp. ID82291 TaxID=2738136 RepID=UPI0018C3F8D9|nr:hypothetical protein [Planomonospora sp. ID82291]MBG0814470.1 hypothetical protein [Planomonospora sp. ID82291]
MGTRREVGPPGVGRAVTSRVDDDDTLRIEWWEPGDGEILLRHAETGQERSGTDLTGLAAGTWTVARNGMPVATDDPGFSLDGMVAYAARPRDREIRAFRTPVGTLALMVREVRPYVEVTRVDPEDGTIVVEGVLAYGEPPAGPARLVAVARKGPEADGGAALSGRRFTGALRIGPMAAGQARRRVFWDLFAQVGEVRLPLAARLDDIPGKKEKVRFPAQRVDRVRVRPYFTDTDALAVACTVEEGEDA